MRWSCGIFFFQAEDGIRDLVRSRGLGDVYKRQHLKTGEYIFVYNRGYRYTYKVMSNEFVQPDDISVLSLIHI